MNAIFKLPLSENIKRETSQPTGVYAHENYPESKYAIDFLVPINTPVLAAKDGVVWKIKSDSDEYGLDPKFAEKVNFVALNHGDETFSEYVHLAKNGVIVEIGQEVKTGDVIAYTGLSGCMDLPHLHFNVFKREDGKGISITFDFE